MSTYDKDTKFYWLQLKEDFFEDDAIEWLEEQKPNGRDYAYFYLKLCLKSLKSSGILIRKVGNILIPYDNKKLAELTNMDFDTVTVAMELLKQIGLVQILENGEIYLTQLDNLIGSKSLGALKKQQQIALRKSKNDGGEKEVENLPPKIDIEIDIEKDIELNIYMRMFEEFYNSYPKKRARSDVEKWFKKNKPSNELFEKIMKSLEVFKKSDDWLKSNGQFIPYPRTWLNQKRWEDEIPETEEERMLRLQKEVEEEEKIHEYK